MKVSGRSTAWALLVILSLAGPAFALSGPGLSFTFEYAPATPELPDHYKEAYPELYDALQSYMNWENTKATLVKEMTRRIKDTRKIKKWKERKARSEQLKADKKKMIEDFPDRKKRLLSSVLYFGEKAILSNSSDPHILLMISLLYYPIHDKVYSIPATPTPETIPGPEPVEEKAPVQGGDADQQAEGTPATDDEAAESKPDQGLPEDMGSSYIMNVHRILAACREILNKHAEFPKHYQAAQLLAEAYRMNQEPNKAAIMWKKYVEAFPESPILGSALFQMAQINFFNPQSFDRYTQ
ncbi:MAG: hypothetical protein GY847_31615, partial [Proteobacteria bacterium]|nr:hypothetical protein [Pseudomonadota bacterium]